MYKLSSFMEITALENTVPGAVSPIGELTPTANTSSREVAKYNNSAYPDVRLVSFSSIDTASGNKIPVDPLYSTKLLQLGQWLFTKSIDGALSDNKEVALQMTNQEFNGILEILAMGKMITNGNYWMPEYVFVKELSSADDNILRVWFSDVAFRAQYELHELIVVPPIAVLDDFHKPAATVKALIDAINIPDHLLKAQELTKDAKETLLASRNYNWVDKIDAAITYPVPWTCAIYGLSGNNEDVIRQVLVDYILDNSVFPREEWEKIFPDLFRPTEFYIVPVWDRLSLPPQQTAGGVYSPTLPLKHFLGYGQQFVKDADDDFLMENLQAVASNYKGLLFVAAGNPRNRNELFKFDVLWPKYINYSTTHIDFNRIPVETQAFILFLVELFITAEKLDEYSELPTGTTRIERNGKVYLSKSLNNVLYLVSVKANTITH